MIFHLHCHSCLAGERYCASLCNDLKINVLNVVDLFI